MSLNKEVLMNNFINMLKIKDNHIISIVKKGLKFSLSLTIISILILLTYNYILLSPILYTIGFSLLKTSLFFICFFIIFGIAFDTIQKQISK